MCYGSLDPKLAMRETEARLKGVSFQSATDMIPVPAPGFGPLIWVRSALARLRQKELRDV
jgi:hypothetical protein